MSETWMITVRLNLRFQNLQRKGQDIQKQSLKSVLERVSHYNMMNNIQDNAEVSMSSGEENAQMSYFQQFKQQMLRAWLPVPTLAKTVVLFYIMGTIFFGVGIPMLILSNQIQEVRVRYDNQCVINTVCTVNFEIPTTMPTPVFFYYQLNNFYQNHRLYANSVDGDQLSGKGPSSDAQTKCFPIVKNSDLYIKNAIDNTPLVQSAMADPCGMVAYSIFNDTYIIVKPDGSTLSSLTTEGIAWPSDSARYKLTNPSTQWLNLTDPRVMNWMRIASLPDFKKLWGKINEDLPSGSYTIQITNNYDLQQFGASKYFVFSTTNIFGSKNLFLSIMYLIMGFLCFMVGTLFLIRRCNKKKKNT